MEIIKEEKEIGQKPQKSENGQKKIRRKWATWLILITSCKKILGTRKLKREVVL